MKNIDIVDMGGHRPMGRDAARGMVRIAKCTLILVSEKKTSQRQNKVVEGTKCSQRLRKGCVLPN